MQWRSVLPLLHLYMAVENTNTRTHVNSQGPKRRRICNGGGDDLRGERASLLHTNTTDIRTPRARSYPRGFAQTETVVRACSPLEVRETCACNV